MTEKLKELLEKERPKLVSYIGSIVQNGETAEDIVQETMLRAHQNISGLKDEDRLEAWLYKIATNICRDHFRKQKSTKGQILTKKSGVDLQSLRDENAPQLDKVIECAEMGQCVHKYFKKLPDSYRSVIMLHDIEGMTNPEIADMLNISLDTAKIRLHRARKRLREILKNVCDFHIDERGIFVCEPKKAKTL
jgi:RNA polymerase sigma-70 factor (ECF subfamily)